MESQLYVVQTKMYTVGRYSVVVLLWRTIERNRIMAQHNGHYRHANIPCKETMELEAFPDDRVRISELF
jgi:hypothetical protein